MQIAIPTKFKINHVLVFSTALFLGQLLTGTTLILSALTMLYLLFFTVAYNLSGGLAYPSGAWIFFNGTLSAIIGLTYKVVIGEPLQSNLSSPNVTLEVYCAGMAMVALASYGTRQFRRTRPLLKAIPADHNMRSLALLCLIVGVLLNLFSFLLPFSIYTAISQLNRFGEAAIILGVFYEVKASAGQRSSNWIVWVAGLQAFTVGVLGFSKEGMFAPILAWLLSAIILKFRFSQKQVLGIILVALFCVTYLAPYSQIARREQGSITTWSDNFGVAVKYLEDLPATRREYLRTTNSEEYNQGFSLYNKPQGIFNRLEMIAFDDGLITFTDEHRPIGYGPTYLGYLNLIPHFLYPSKPSLRIGNMYAREIGMVPESDTTTGISFSPFGDAYHQGKWVGIFLLIPVVLFLLFIISDSLVGDTRNNPYGVVLIALFAHVAPEGVIEQQIHMSVFAPLSIIAIAILARYILPLFVAMRSSGRVAD
jgi:hypothetical protein